MPAKKKNKAKDIAAGIGSAIPGVGVAAKVFPEIRRGAEDFGRGVSVVGEKVLDKVGLGKTPAVDARARNVGTKSFDDLFGPQPGVPAQRAGGGNTTRAVRVDPATGRPIQSPTTGISTGGVGGGATVQARPTMSTRIDPNTGRPMPVVSQQPTNAAAEAANFGTAAPGAATLANPNALGGGPITNQPIVNPAEAAAARQQQAAFRDQQQQLANLLLAQAQGIGGPTAAQALLRQGTDEAIRQQIGASTAQSGVSGGAALRQGQEAGVDLQQRAVAQGAALRAQEQQQAQQQLGQLLQGARAGDIETAAQTTQSALQDRALQLQEFGIVGKQATDRMALELQERLGNRGLAVDLEKLRATTEVALSGQDIQVALARAGFSAAQSGAILQLLGGLGASAIGAG